MIALVFSVISLFLCVFGFFFFRWYIARKTAARELLTDYRAEVSRLTAEIDAAADRDSLLVEERIKALKKSLDNTDHRIEEQVKTLQKLLDDTDRRISVYIRELERSRTGEAMYASLGRGIRAALDSRPQEPLDEAPPAEVSPAETETDDTNGTHKIEASPTEVSPTESVSPAETMADGKRKPKKNRIKAQIAEMSAQGLSPAEIAARLNLSLAEVDLALNLLPAPTGSKQIFTGHV